MFLSIATIADVSLRDDQSRMDAILRAQPVSNSVHYGARFAGAFAVAVLLLSRCGVRLCGRRVHAMGLRQGGRSIPARAYALAFLIMALPTCSRPAPCSSPSRR